MRFYGELWGGNMTVCGLFTTKGRIVIGVTNDNGRQYCISVSRWLNERKQGNIVEVRQ